MFHAFWLYIPFLISLSMMPLFAREPAITIYHEKNTPLVNLVETCLNETIAAEAPLREGIYAIRGMSGRKYRLFINTLIKNLPHPSYLEIGSWMGSTLCSAIYENSVNAVAIDNWSEFGGPRSQFLENVQTFANPQVSLRIIEKNFRWVDYQSLGSFNVYLFDGPHSEKDQYDGLNRVLDALDDEFVFIVDDWNWPQVRKGTKDAIELNHLEILYSAEIRTTLDDTHPPLEQAGEADCWHNGYYISVLRKCQGVFTKKI